MMESISKAAVLSLSSKWERESVNFLLDLNKKKNIKQLEQNLFFVAARLVHRSYHLPKVKTTILDDY